MSLFHSNNSIKFSLAAVSTCLLAACGGASDSSPKPTANAAISPINAFESTLTIQLENQPTALIASKTGTDQELAYSVHSKIYRNSANKEKSLVFDLSTLTQHQTLIADLNPMTNQYNDITIEIEPVNNTDIFARKRFRCDRVASNFSSFDLCNATVSYNEKTGMANIQFNQSTITDGAESITLNGALKGTLSIAPNSPSFIPANASAKVSLSAWHGQSSSTIETNYPATELEFINNNQKKFIFEDWSAQIINDKIIGHLNFKSLILDPENAEVITRFLLLDYSCALSTCQNAVIASPQIIKLNNTPLNWSGESRPEQVNATVNANGTIQLYGL